MNSVDRAIHHVFGLTVTGGVGSVVVVGGAAGEARVIGGKGWGLMIVPSLLPASIIPPFFGLTGIGLHQIPLFFFSPFASL